jgi:hypothetical protein
MDLMLLLDGSASIDSASWLKILQFTANIGLNFTTGHDFMRYGVVQFASLAHTYMNLEANNATFQQTIGMMPQMAESTNTSGGVAVVEQEFNARARPGSFKALVILTDGMWNTGGSPLDITDRLKKNGTHIFTVGVGAADLANVQALASKPLSKYYYNVTNEDMLPLILHKMIWNMCVREVEHDGSHISPFHMPRDTQKKATSLQPLLLADVGAPRYPAVSLQPPQLYGSGSMTRDSARAPFDCGGNTGGRWIRFVNAASNPVRINLCSLDFNKQICKGGPPSNVTYTTCDATGSNKGVAALSFIPANSTMALRIDLNVTYIVAIYCVSIPGVSVHCLSTPTPREFYGPTAEGGKHWPITLQMPANPVPYCAFDHDCPAPFTHCNVTSTSGICE